MILDISAPLKAVWDLLKPLLSERLKGAITKEKSSEKARRLSLDLFRALRQVADLSAEFVLHLREYGKNVGDAVDAEVTSERRSLLLRTAAALSREMEDMSLCLEELDPQLSIHLPQVVARLNQYRTARGQIARYHMAGLFTADRCPTTSPNFPELLKEAEHNHGLLAHAIEEFRGFLSETFDFKESF